MCDTAVDACNAKTSAANTLILICILPGRGVFAKQVFEKGAFLLTYHGELISGKEGNKREEETSSVFRYFFRYQEKKWW